MDYKIEARFSGKAINALGDRFTENAKNGYKFHSVIHIEKSGCLGTNWGASITYLAVYVKE